MKYALTLPPFGELSDPATMVEVALVAESAGWDGVFLWDHILRPPGQPPEVADPWIMLAAIAMATTTLRLGPMVTPITRRRPIKLAREAVTLDHLSAGRVTLGLGLGVDTSGELSRFGEVLDAKLRGQRLDEGIELLCSFWSGETVHFAGEHFIADGVDVLPRPVQRPRIPLWLAARATARKPVRRAARYDGLYPIEVDAKGLREMLEAVREERGGLEDFDVATSPSNAQEFEDFAEAGMTWALKGAAPGTPLDEVFAMASTHPSATF